jgi:hypothetical protein
MTLRNLVGFWKYIMSIYIYIYNGNFEFPPPWFVGSTIGFFLFLYLFQTNFYVFSGHFDVLISKINFLK